MKQSEVIQDLIKKTNFCINVAQEFRQLDDQKLQYSVDEKKWNALQCLEHLNRYGNFYIPEFNRILNSAKVEENDRIFKAGFLGAYFTKLMLPKKGKMIKMKTFADKNPEKNEVSLSVIDEFIGQQKLILDILQKATKVNINKNKCKLTIPVLKMNLGATLQFIIFHHIRHIEQAQRAVARS